MDENKKKEQVLLRKLERSEFKRSRLEVKIDKHYSFLRRVVSELDQAKTNLELIQEDLEKRVKNRTQALRETNELLLTEIKERVAVEQKLRNANDALVIARDGAEKASQEKSLFLANMSHELRTPLAAIIGFTELMAEELEEKGLENLQSDTGKVHTAAQHLLSVINDVLDLSKIEAGKTRVERSSFSIPVLVREVVETIRPLVDQGNNTITYEFETLEENAVQDRNKLKQCLINLLGNAAKFTSEGSIKVWTGTSTNELTIKVTDDGVGIPSDRFRDIFSAFTQADNSSTRAYQGTGLGLAITQHFCQLMGGSISVESTLGEGSEFTLTVPFEHPAALVEASSLSNSESHKVLMIDDDPDVHEMIGGFLKDLGIDSHSAFSGEKGLQLAKVLQPKMITLDIMMSGISGWKVLEDLQNDPLTAGIPVAIISYVDEPEKAKRLGACKHVLKPIERRSVAELLSAHLDTF